MKKSLLHIAPCHFDGRPHQFHDPRRSVQSAAPMFLVGCATVALLSIAFFWIFSVWPRNDFKNGAENWLLADSQVQTTSDGTTVRVAYYTEPPPEGWRIADPKEVKYLFDKGLAVPPQIGMVTSSKTIVDVGGFNYSAPKILGRFSHSAFVKAGGTLVTVAFLEYGEIKTGLVPADSDLRNCKTVLVPKAWKRPIDVGDKRVATTDSRVVPAKK